MPAWSKTWRQAHAGTYRLNPVALAALRDQLDTYWQRALAGYADAVEAPTEEDA